MAKYTTTIQEYCQSVYINKIQTLFPLYNRFDIVAEMPEEQYYEIVRNYIFPTVIPFYNSVETDITAFVEEWTDHFMYYEIGQDSVEKFRTTLKAWLKTNMPLYKKLYDSDISSVAAALNNTDVTITRTGSTSIKTGTLSTSGSTTYGKQEKFDSTFKPGKNTKNSIVALGTSATERELSATGESGTDTTDSTNKLSGTDQNSKTDTYNLNDGVNTTETRSGRENVDLLAATEKYRSLILDMNSEIFKQMKKDGLFMLVW